MVSVLSSSPGYKEIDCCNFDNTLVVLSFTRDWEAYESFIQTEIHLCRGKVAWTIEESVRACVCSRACVRVRYNVLDLNRQTRDDDVRQIKGASGVYEDEEYCKR